MLELRLDPRVNGTDGQAMAALSLEVARRLPDKLLLLTFRTRAEGGKVRNEWRAIGIGTDFRFAWRCVRFWSGGAGRSQ